MEKEIIFLGSRNTDSNNYLRAVNSLSSVIVQSPILY
jgi:hypothetical protein